MTSCLWPACAFVTTVRRRWMANALTITFTLCFIFSNVYHVTGTNPYTYSFSETKKKLLRLCKLCWSSCLIMSIKCLLSSLIISYLAEIRILWINYALNKGTKLINLHAVEWATQLKSTETVQITSSASSAFHLCWLIVKIKPSKNCGKVWSFMYLEFQVIRCNFPVWAQGV